MPVAPIIITVFSDGIKTEVPVTPETKISDLIECCRDPGDELCELICPENGGLPLSDSEHPFDILQRWGSGRLMLKYTALPTEEELPQKRNGMKEPDHFGETLPPEGAPLPSSSAQQPQPTLGELREMACRQQAQIERQRQLLAAREQRLRWLREQEVRARRAHQEGERLRRLRERVDAQETKLRRLRALRGHVDGQRQANTALTSDLDSIRALFNEKEKELSLAVAKVEELTRQLEELRKGRNSARDPPPPSALELDKLRRELMYRNKLNEQQNLRLNQQREALTARQEEMSAIDRRISELQERLHRKRLLNQQLASQISATSHKAAYHQLVRLTGSQDQTNQGFARKPNPNGLSRGNIAAVEPYNHLPLQQNNIRNGNHVQEKPTYPEAYQQDSSNEDELSNKMATLFSKQEDNEVLKDFSVSKSDPKYQTLPYNTKFTVNLLPSKPKIEGSSEELSHISTQANGNVNIQAAHMTVHSAPLNILNKNIATPLNQQDLLSRKLIESKESSNINNNDDLLKNQNDIAYHSTPTSSSVPINSYQKPISSVAPTSIHHTGILSNVYQTSSIKVQPVEPQTISNTNSKSVSYSTQVQSPQSIILSPPQSTSTPLGGTPEVSLDKTPKPALPPKPAIKPPPRQTQQQQILEDTNVKPPPVPMSDPPDENKPSPIVGGKPAIAPPIVNQKPSGYNKSLPSPPIGQSSSSANEMVIKAKPLTIKKQAFCEQPKLRNNVKMNGRKETISMHFPELQNLDKDSTKEVSKVDETDRSSRSSNEDNNEVNSKDSDNVIRRCKKGNLKQSGKSNLSRRVSFDPLALLLDASLEGELELVKKTATQVPNPSAANDEGITALHNAICAGHLEIVKFLVEFGCDVNAQDSDGWTPLHCAASCNNLTMVKFLVEHGACIFATTLSDHETAAEKCEEDEEGFDGCSEYLYSVQEKLGILNGGLVYAVFDYTAQQQDELSFQAGEQFTILRKGDENEREWWWARLGDKEGYVPRNLLGLYPRVQRSEE